MDPEDLRDLYDESYVEGYERKFLEEARVAPDTRYEEHLLAAWLTPGSRWLDVACGTGHFLSLFPDIERTGLDLSPSMIAKASSKNPGVEIREHDFRVPAPEWADSFDLVTCMWYAYGYVDDMRQLRKLIANLADWASPGGRVFLPICDPNLLTRATLPDRIPYAEDGDDVAITGILWTYRDQQGQKVHRDMVAPSVTYLVELFAEHFELVDVIRYPESAPGVGRRPAIVATRKRARLDG